jgi:hypothetical protein
MLALPNGTTNFSLELSDMELTSQNITYGPKLIFDPLIPYNGSYEATDGYPNNGSFHGINETDQTVHGTWSFGLNGFVSPMYGGFNAPFVTYPPQTPASLINLTGAQIFPSTLLLQSYEVDEYVLDSTKAYCEIEQVYVESNLTCKKDSSSSKSCSVYAQRPSQLRHAPSAITPLSFPEIFKQLAIISLRPSRSRLGRGRQTLRCFI